MRAWPAAAVYSAAGWVAALLHCGGERGGGTPAVSLPAWPGVRWSQFIC